VRTLPSDGGANEGGSAEGFVAADRLRSPLGYRLLANRTAEGWKLTAFLAGD